MGVVVAATHLELGHRVAIKLLRDEVAANPAIVERFQREAKAVVGLRTEHVCRVSDVGRLDGLGTPYIVMEMLDGVDLQRTVTRSPLPLTTAVEYVLQACVALAEAHAAGIIHRDLKPANLFVTRRLDGGPLVKVLDFGIAKALMEPGVHATSATPMGSPGYMSPEQIESARDVDVRTDIWALGATLYQLLSARLPFGGTNLTAIAINVMTEAPAPIDTDPRLRAVILKCLEKKPENRYASAIELMMALAPFGGPSARHYINLAAQLGGGRSAFPTPTSQRVVQPSELTAFTEGQSVARRDPTPIVPVKTSSVTTHHKGRNIVLAVIALVLLVGGIGGWMAAFKKQPTVVVVAPSDAAVVQADAIVVDAAIAELIPPADARKATAKKLTPPPTTSGSNSAVKAQAHDVWGNITEKATPGFAKTCAVLFKGGSLALRLSPRNQRMQCACLVKNQKVAEDTLQSYDAEDRPSIRAGCNKDGVVIP
jgi:hypothetical protein